jgi:hypothetical protein
MNVDTSVKFHGDVRKNLRFDVHESEVPTLVKLKRKRMKIRYFMFI